MWTVQLTGEKTGFGLGFFVDEYAGHKAVHHRGAVYGFSSAIYVLPDAGIAVVVLCNEDLARGPVSRIVYTALDAMLEAKLGQKPEARLQAMRLDAAELAKFVGDYESPGYWAEIRVVDGRLRANISGQIARLTPVGPRRFEADGYCVHRAPVEFLQDEDEKIVDFKALEQTFRRVDPKRKGSIPEVWRRYLGSYGPDFIPLIVSERNGRLYAMTENLMDYRLTPVTGSVFELPKGLYEDEYAVFHLDENGRAHRVEWANVPLRRREPVAATDAEGP
jgi:hypothetical protein